MNKKLMLAGLLFVAGFITLTAFGGQTLAQQKQEIAATIAAQLDEFRLQKQDECTMRVNEEAQRRYQEYLASAPAEMPKMGTAKSTKKKSTTTKAPLPQTVPTDPQKTRSGAVQEGNVEEQKKRSGAVPQGDATEQKKRPGAVKEGGN